MKNFMACMKQKVKSKMVHVLAWFMYCQFTLLVAVNISKIYIARMRKKHFKSRKWIFIEILCNSNTCCNNIFCRNLPIFHGSMLFDIFFKYVAHHFLTFRTQEKVNVGNIQIWQKESNFRFLSVFLFSNFI